MQYFISANETKNSIVFFTTLVNFVRNPHCNFNPHYFKNFKEKLSTQFCFTSKIIYYLFFNSLLSSFSTIFLKQNFIARIVAQIGDTSLEIRVRDFRFLFFMIYPRALFKFLKWCGGELICTSQFWCRNHLLLNFYLLLTRFFHKRVGEFQVFFPHSRGNIKTCISTTATPLDALRVNKDRKFHRDTLSWSDVALPKSSLHGFSKVLNKERDVI